MGEKISIKATGDPAELLRMQDKVIRKQGQMIGKLRQTASESKNAAEVTKQSNTSALGSISKMASGYLSVTAAIAAAVAEVRDLERAGKAAASTIERIQEARVSAAFSFPLNIPRAEFETFVKDTARPIGLRGDDALRLAGELGSASAGASPEQIKSAVATTLNLATRSSELDATSLGGAVLDTLKATGQTDSNVALGFLAKIGTQARIPNLSVLSRAAPAALAAGSGVAGVKPEEAAALFAFLTQQTVDTTGESSATGVVSITEQLFGKQTVPSIGKDGKLGFEFLANVRPDLAEGGGLFETLEFFQKQIGALPPEFRTEALDKLLAGKGGIRAAFRNLATNQPRAARELQGIRSAITAPGPADIALVDNILQFADSGAGSALVNVRRRGAGAVEAIQEADPLEAFRVRSLSELRKIERSFPRSIRPPLIKQTATDFFRSFGSPGSVVREAETSLAVARIAAERQAPRGIDPAERVALDQLSSFVEVLRKEFEGLKDELRKNTNATQQNTTTTSVGPPVPDGLLDSQGEQ